MRDMLSLFAANCNSNFFGLVPWYKYIKTEADCSIRTFNVFPKGNDPSDIPFVLLAVVDNLLRIAGLLAVIFIIYGSVQYITSQGSPDQTSKAQSTIINSLIGLVVAIIAVAFVSFIGNRIS